MMPGTFPTFLTFLTRKPCFPAFAAAPWQGPEITPYGGQHRLGPAAVGFERDEFGRAARICVRYTMSRVSASRIGAVMSRGS
jgi:hypothetical protein